MKLRIFAFVFVVWLCFPRSANAQLDSGCFAAHYSSYTNTSLSTNDSIIQTVQESGYTEAKNPAVWMGPQLGWQYPCTNQTNQMQSSTHTSNIRNVVGSTGGNYSQGPTPALSYNNYVVSITAPATPGTIYTTETNSEVVCIIAGTIFAALNLINKEVAFTRFVTAGYLPETGPPPLRHYFIGPYCTAPTTPPDWNGAGLNFQTPEPPGVPTGIADGKTICARIGTSGSWTCLPFGKWVGSYNAPYVLGICTHNP